jgi:uncharacterized protein
MGGLESPQIRRITSLAKGKPGTIHARSLCSTAFPHFSPRTHSAAASTASSGAEVDFVLGKGEVAIEVEGASRIDNSDLRPLAGFIEGYRPGKSFVVCNERISRVREGIHILPWRDFLDKLWNGLVIS